MFIPHHQEDGSSEDTEKDRGEDFISAEAFNVIKHNISLNCCCGVQKALRSNRSQ